MSEVDRVMKFHAKVCEVTIAEGQAMHLHPHEAVMGLMYATVQFAKLARLDGPGLVEAFREALETFFFLSTYLGCPMPQTESELQQSVAELSDQELRVAHDELLAQLAGLIGFRKQIVAKLTLVDREMEKRGVR